MTYDIAAVRRAVLSIYPFFGGVASSVEYVETDEVRRVHSDGRTVFYHPAYLAELSVGQQVFVLAHELCHIAFGHTARGKGKDQEIWKTATDAVINQQLKRDGLELLSDSIDYPEAIDFDAEQFYEFLLQHKLQMELTGGSIDPEKGSVQKQEEELEQGDDDSRDDDDSMEGEKHPNGEPDPEDGKLLEEEATEDAQLEEEELAEEDLALVPRKVSKAGNADLRDTRQVQEIGVAVPVIDWRAVLRDTINHDVDWSLSNAVLEDGVVRPVLEGRPIPETEIVLDTSWSVDEDLLRGFLRECKNILQHAKLRVGCFDTVFYGFHEIRTEEDIETMVFEGGGGTDFNVAVEAFTLRVDNRIIFTDGQAPVPQMPLDAIWMVYGDEKIEPKGGKVIHITPQQRV